VIRATIAKVEKSGTHLRFCRSLGVSKQLALFEVSRSPKHLRLGDGSDRRVPTLPSGETKRDSRFDFRRRGKFEHLHWLAVVAGGYPERLMSNYIHDQRIVGLENDIWEPPAIFTVKRKQALHPGGIPGRSVGFTTARTPKRSRPSAVMRPAQEVSHNPNPRQFDR